jgi:hypothetical protein
VDEPRVLDPDIQVHRRTKYSDCYALGMVVYEVFTGRKPFYQHPDHVVVGKVSRGGRPEGPRVEGVVWFTDDVWEILELCWAPLPQDRLGIEDVLDGLEKAASYWTLPSLPSMAAPPAGNSPIWTAFDITSERSTGVDAGQVSPPSRASDKLPPEGGTDDDGVDSPAHELLLYGLPVHQVLGADGTRRYHYRLLFVNICQFRRQTMGTQRLGLPPLSLMTQRRPYMDSVL